jgi:nucleosome assembly protein 1-like 1
LTTLKHHDEFAEMITERDEAALKNLLNIRAKTLVVGVRFFFFFFFFILFVSSLLTHFPFPHQSSFALEFYFGQNEFFENEVLTKTYHLVEDKKTGEVMYDHAES